MKKRSLRLLALCCLVCVAVPGLAFARTPYKTFTVNGYGEMQETQTAYTVDRIISCLDGGGKNDVMLADAKKDLRGLFVAPDGRIFLTFAERRKSFVYIADADGNLLGSITDSAMTNPTDVFVADNGHVYVADPDASFTGSSTVQQISLTPEEPKPAEDSAEAAEAPSGPAPVFDRPELVYDPETEAITLTLTATVTTGEGDEAEETKTEYLYVFERESGAREDEAAEPGDGTAEADARTGKFDGGALEGVWTVRDSGIPAGSKLILREDGYALTLPGTDYTSAGTWSVREVKLVLHGAVFEFDQDGALVHTYLKPDNPLYGAKTPFKPMKVAVNHAGILYIICDGNNNGIVEIAPGENGEPDTFLGYFGTNFASVGAWDLFLRMIRTAEQRSMTGNSTNPRSPTNLDLDSRGLIYTVTQGDGAATLKHLNIAGNNLIAGAMSVDKPADVSAGLNDNVFVADEDGFIYEFDSRGELIFVFGGKDDGTSRAGLFTKVTAIDVGPDGCLYILDSSQKTVTVLSPTEFTVALHDALGLYATGRYTESKEPLDKVLDMNGMFDVANRAMGRALFQEEDYGESLRFARLAKDKDGYSDAYWEVRNVWLKRNIAIVFIVILALVVIRWIVRLFDRKYHFLDRIRPKGGRLSRSRYLSDLRYSFFYMRHPIDGSYGIAREGRASWAVSLTLLAVFIIEFLINKYFCGFLQKAVQDGRYEVFSDVGGLLAAMIGLVGCNYLVCTINEGESTVKKIASYFCYSLTPYVLLTPVIFLLSLVLTKNEQFLITMLQILTYGWMLVILVLGIREVNNYTGKQTAKIILLTLFTLLILALIIFILYVLWAQVFKFIGEIIGEVKYRAG